MEEKIAFWLLFYNTNRTFQESHIMSYKKIADTNMEAIRVLCIDYSNYLCSTNATATIVVWMDIDNRHNISGYHHGKTNYHRGTHDWGRSNPIRQHFIL